jgi:hypothetical protein
VAVPQFFLRVIGEFADDQGGQARPPAGRIREERIDIPEAALAGLPFLWHGRLIIWSKIK